MRLNRDADVHSSGSINCRSQPVAESAADATLEIEAQRNVCAAVKLGRRLRAGVCERVPVGERLFRRSRAQSEQLLLRHPVAPAVGCRTRSLVEGRYGVKTAFWCKGRCALLASLRRSESSTAQR
jgi:hypothetical protein